MKELKQVEYPDIQLIAEGTGKILRFGNRANQEKLGPRRVKKHQGPESRPELNLSKKGKQRHFSNCKALKWISWLRENPDAKDKPKEK